MAAASPSAPSDNLYITGLPADATDELVKSTFGSYGVVVQCRVLRNASPGQCKCAALVRFQFVQSASWVVNNLNGTVPQGLTEAIMVRYADTPVSKAQRNTGWQMLPMGMPGRYADSSVKGMGKRSAMGKPGMATPIGQFGGFGDGQRIVSKGGMHHAGDMMKGGKAGSFPRSANTDRRLVGSTTVQQISETGKSYGIMTIVRAFESCGAMPGEKGFKNNDSTLYIAGLPSDCEDLHLYQLFSCFGAIAPKGVRAVMNPDGTCKGIGFVNFLNPEPANRAILTFNGQVLPDGSMIKVAIKMTSSGKSSGSAPSTA